MILKWMKKATLLVSGKSEICALADSKTSPLLVFFLKGFTFAGSKEVTGIMFSSSVSKQGTVCLLP